MILHLLFIIINLGFLSNKVQSFRFDLPSGHTKCITEDIKSNSMSVGKYFAVNPYAMNDSSRLNVRVLSEKGNIYHQADNVEAGEFAFTAIETSVYTACFWIPAHTPPSTVVVDFEWKSGVIAKDWSNVARKGNIDRMVYELRQMFDTVSSINDEMSTLREREEEMQELNRATNAGMAWLSFLSLFVCLSVAGLQIWHLKSFFERKKLL